MLSCFTLPCIQGSVIRMNNIFAILLSIIGAFSFCISSAVPAFSQDSSVLKPIGSFSNYSGSNDHAYGYQVMLWSNGSKLFGSVIKWNGGLGGHTGDIERGLLRAGSGDIRFNVTIRQVDIDPVEITTAIFQGRIVGKTIIGSFIYQGKKAKFEGDNGVAKVILKLQKNIRLLTFSGLKAWKKAGDKRYK